MIHTIIENKVEEKIQEVVRAIQPKSQITDKTLLPSFFEDLHNLLWNKAGLNPESALAHMTFFFAYRLIEQQADALSLPQECRWSYVANIRNEQDLFDTVKRGVSSFRLNPKTKPFFKPHEIQKCDIVAEIVHQINRISLTILQETDTLGDVFEYMLGRGMSTMSDEGQYFTNREICRLAFKLAFQIKKKLRRDDGSLCTFADWFCGTGGFPAEYVKGVKTHLQDIDWRKDCGAIYCQDMNTSSVTTTLLNMLILTGIPFSDQNIRSSNSFSDAITTGAGAPFPRLSLDYCFMNPPYGGDKTKGKEYKFAYSKTVKADDDGTKTKRFYVNQEIQSIGIEDDDKVSAGVQLGMATLSADGGVCCLVLPQGFFFGASKKCVDLRKKIAEEYKIWYVVDIASGSFLNTGTKTSMIVFQKGVGETEKILFIGLDEKVLVEATLEELRAKNYSLNYKQYMAQTVVEVEGFEMMKLGDIADWQMGKRIVKDQVESGIYPVYGGGGITFNTNICNRNGINCKISREGMSEANCVLMIVGDYYQNSQGMTVVSKDPNKVINSYLWNWLVVHKKDIYKCGQGTAQKAINMVMLNDIDIPIPSLERQQQIVESIDGFAQLAHHEEQALKMIEKQIMFFVKEMGRGQPRVKLGEVCEFQRGKMITKKELVEGEFPVIGGGLSPMGYHTSSNRKAYTSLISQSGENAGHISRYTKPVWASDCFSVSSSKMNDDFLYYSLIQIQDEINFLKTGTAQPHIYPSSIDSLTVVVPSLVEQETLQSDFEEIRHKHAKIAEYKKKAQDAIKRLIPGA
jgi:type I restriction enzyme S subunit